MTAVMIALVTMGWVAIEVHASIKGLGLEAKLLICDPQIGPRCNSSIRVRS